MNLQKYWNSIENVIITSVDKIASLEEKRFPSPLNKETSFFIKSKINKRNWLLKINNKRKNNLNSPMIKVLSHENKITIVMMIGPNKT